MYQDLYDLLIEQDDQRVIDPFVLAILDRHYGQKEDE